jgi:DNA-directed RNA polymerase specialized sigma24 family protein
MCESGTKRLPVVSRLVEESTSMLAEKFLLVLETIISHHHSGEASRVRSNSPHIPVKLPVNDFLRRSGGVLRAQGLRRSTWAGVSEEMRRDVLSKLAKLPDDQLAVLLLVAVEGLSYSAAAKVLDIPMGAAMSCLSQARETLQREIEGRADVDSSNIVRLRILK